MGSSSSKGYKENKKYILVCGGCNRNCGKQSYYNYKPYEESHSCPHCYSKTRLVAKRI